MMTLNYVLDRTVSFLKQLLKNLIMTSSMLSLFSLSIVLVISIVSGVPYEKLLLELIRPIALVFSEEPDFSDLIGIVVNAAPLILTAFAFTVPFKCGYFNIGADGVMIVSALSYVIAFNSVDGVYAPVTVIVLPIVVSIAVGALWGSVPIVLKRVTSTNEVISGLVLNYISLISVGFLLAISKTVDSSVSGTQSISFSERFAILFPGIDASGKVITFLLPLSLGIILFVALWLWSFRGGLNVRSVGANSKAASMVGLETNAAVLLAVLIGSFCAILCALNETIAYNRFSVDAIKGLGFDGIMVAILGDHRLTGIIIASLFWSLWRNYGSGIQNLQLPSETLLCAQALFLVAYLWWQRYMRLEVEFI